MTVTELNMIATKIKTLFALKTELGGGGHTDAEINALVAQYLADNPQDTTLTDAQVDDIIEAYFIANPPTDQVRTDTEINALIAIYIQSHPELVTTDQEVIDIHNQQASAADMLTQAQVDAIVDSISEGADGNPLLSSVDPFGDGSLDRAYLFEGNGDDLLGNHHIAAVPTTGLSYADGEIVIGNTIDSSDLPDIGVGFSANTQFYATVKAGAVSTQLFSFGNGDSSNRIYISASIDASGIPRVFIRFRNGSGSGTYWYYNNTVVNPVAAGDKVGIYIEKYINGGTATKVYINGVLATQSAANGGTTYTPSGTMHLGAVTDNNSPYSIRPSSLDTLHFFNRSLTEAEIISLQP